MWIHVYRKKEADNNLQRQLTQQQENLVKELESLTSKEFICEPDARKELNAFIKSH
jgi:hypothetical protein